MSLSELYESDTDVGRRFKQYVDHWISNPGFDSKLPTKEELFEYAVVKSYADYLMSNNFLDFSESNGISGINGISKKSGCDSYDLIDDKSC